MFDFEFEELPPADAWAPSAAPPPAAARPARPAASTAPSGGSALGAFKLHGSANERTVGTKLGGDPGRQRAAGRQAPPISFGSAGHYQAFKEPRIFTVLARVLVLRQSRSLDAPWRGVRQCGELVQAVGGCGTWLCLADTESALDGAGSESLWLHTVVGEDGSSSSEAAASAALSLFRGVGGAAGAPAEDAASYPSVGQSSVQEVDHLCALALYTQAIVERCSDTFAPPLGCMTTDPRRLAGAFTPAIHAPGAAKVRAQRGRQPAGDCGLDPWRVFAAHRHSRDEVIEMCPLLEAKSRAYRNSEALSSRMVSCVGSRALPLGFGSLYRRAGRPGEANAYLGVCSSAGVLVLHAAREIYTGEELVMSGDALPKYLDGDLWQLQGRGIGAAIPWSPQPALQAGLTAGAVRWGRSPVHDRGVFAAVPFETGDVVELCPAVVLEEATNGVFDDFTMEFSDLWGHSAQGKKKFSVLALGFGPLYNHRDPGFNVAWGWLEGFGVVEMRAVREIEEGEELFISYGSGYWETRGTPR